MKCLSRAVVVNLLAIYVIAFFYHFKIELTNESSIGVKMLFVWGGISAILGIIWWMYMFYHWGTSTFVNYRSKRIWFFVLFLGTFLYLIGPILYYILVYELKKGIKESDPDRLTENAKLTAIN